MALIVPVYRLLHRHGAADRIHGARKHDHQAITEVLDLLSAVPCDRVAQQPEVRASQLLGRIVPDTAPG